jgi:hypothetical protein
MKKHCFLVIWTILLLFSSKISAQVNPVLPVEPFGVTGLSKPDVPCGTLLVGYVNFQYNGTGATPANWNINDITCYGPATQTITTNVNYTAGSVYNTNNYSIVKNPSTMTGGTFQNITAPGGYFVTHNGTQNALTYKITGLNSPLTDFGTNGTTYPIPAGLIYYVRIKVHNFGTQGGCSNAGNNIEVTFKSSNGGDFSQGSQLFYDANRNRGQNGRWMSQSPICPGNNQSNQSWGGWGQINNPVGYDGVTATLEGCFAVGAGLANFAADNGFQITIKSLDRNGDNIFGVESIEVYGCLPKKLSARDGLDPNITGTNFCENGPVDITAAGAGFGTNIQWYKGEGNTPPATAPIGAGNTLHTTAPQGVNNSEKYWAVGTLNGQQVFDTVRIYSSFCCSALGQTNIVFEEHFPMFVPQTICGQATISPLNPANGTTTYNYTGNNNACSLDENEYAIVTNSYWSFWNNRTRVDEHTGTQNSGAMMINAGSNTSQFFYELTLSGLCPGTQYEFSAWYVSIAAAGQEGPSDITFQIYENQMSSPFVSESTGLFGGTANAAHNSSFVWRKKTIIFTTPPLSSTATQYILRLKNNQGSSSGNDLLIDDIVVTKCVPTLYLYQDGTNNTSLSVCSNDNINVAVELSADMVNLISSSSGSIYAQLMSSTTPNVPASWTAVDSPVLVIGNGTASFSITPPATNGVTVYYRVKLSSDQTRAQNVTLPLTSGCFNDVITQSFDITKDGTLGNSPEPAKIPHYICSNTYKDFYTLTGQTPADADLWGWAWNDTTNMSYSGTEANKTFTAVQNGTYYFVYTKGECRAYKIVVINDIFTDTDIPAITINTPAAVCEGSPLNLTAPSITNTVPVNSQGWRLNGVPFVSGTAVTAADNGKTLKYVASNACDTEESNEVAITVGLKYNIPINQQWCVGTRYNQNGFDITPTAEGMVTRTQNLTTVYGCDSIVTLNLDVKSTLNDTVFDTICSAQLPYAWRGHTFPVGTASRQEVYAGQTVNGCDSTVTYNLTVFPSEDTEEVLNICADELPYAYRAFSDTVFGTGTVSGQYTFYSRCSVKKLNLTIAPQITALPPAKKPIACAQDGVLTIELPETAPSPNGVAPTDYTVEFLDKAFSREGFISPQAGIIDNGKITVNIPATVYPDSYFCKITLTSTDGCNELVFDNVAFDIYYPASIMQQKWDDVLALLNKYYNGGYEYIGYQWYKDGGPMAGENRSYIYLKQNKLDPNAEYYVKLTRADGTEMFSCPFDVQTPKPQQSAYPTVVSGDNSITVILTKDNAVARLWTTTGILLQTAKVRPSAPSREISFPAQQGTYLVEVQYQDTMERVVVPITAR